MGKNDLKRAAKHSQNVPKIFKMKNGRQQQHKQSSLLHRGQQQHQQSPLLHCHQQILPQPQRNNDSTTFLRSVTCLINLRKNFCLVNSVRRKQRNVLSRKIFLLHILVSITTRCVIANFAMYAYGHTTTIASSRTILSHNGFLKVIPTGKMQLVREEVSRVNCWEATKKPSSALWFSQRAQKM